MNDDTPLEFELHGYVDGALDDEAMARIEQHLKNHPETAAKVREYLQQKNQIRAFARASEATDKSPVIDKLERQLARRLRRNTLFRWPRVAVIALLFAAGWSAHTLYLPLTDERQYTDDILAAHMLAATTPLQTAPLTLDSIGALFTRIGEEHHLPDLRALGLEPIAAQLLPSHEGAMLHIAYRDAAGTVVSYFLLHDDDDAEVPRHVLQRNGVTLAYWQHHRSRYAIAAPLTTDRIAQIANFIAPEAEQL
jgi:anti-sigma factor RsiW